MLELQDFPDEKTLKSFGQKYGGMDLPGLESWLSILSLAGRLEEELNQFLKDYDLQQSRFFILILLERYPEGMTLSEIASGIGVSNPTMTGIISRMEKSGLVVRKGFGNTKREFRIVSGDKGRTLLQKVLPVHYRRIAAMTAGMTGSDHKNLQKILAKFTPPDSESY